MLILHHSRVRYIDEALYSFPGFFVTLSSFFRIYCRFEGREFRGLGLKLSFWGWLLADEVGACGVGPSGCLGNGVIYNT